MYDYQNNGKKFGKLKHKLYRQPNHHTEYGYIVHPINQHNWNFQGKSLNIMTSVCSPWNWLSADVENLKTYIEYVSERKLESLVSLQWWKLPAYMLLTKACATCPRDSTWSTGSVQDELGWKLLPIYGLYKHLCTIWVISCVYTV